MPRNNNKHADPSPKRIESLTDGVFAIAMTLLVLNLTVPHITQQHALHELPALLSAQANDLFSYFLSFFLLAVFWIIHHRQFHFIERTDGRHLWLNIFILMFIALIPFTTSLVGLYPSLGYTNLCFSGNMLVLGCLFFLNWYHATHQHKLVNSSMTAEHIRSSRARNLVIPAVSIAAMLFTLVSPDWSTSLYIAVPLIMPLVK